MEPGLTASLLTPAAATAGDNFSTVDELERGLLDQRYVAERGLATTLYLTLKLGKPLLLEGEAGVGKTEIAKVLADVLQTPLIRLQCYEGLDAATAIYEWDYPRQMLYLRTVEATGGESRQAVRHDLFSEEFLLSGRCCRQSTPPTNALPSFSSTRSTARIRNWRHSSWSSSPTS